MRIKNILSEVWFEHPLHFDSLSHRFREPDEADLRQKLREAAWRRPWAGVWVNCVPWGAAARPAWCV